MTTRLPTTLLLLMAILVATPATAAQGQTYTREDSTFVVKESIRLLAQQGWKVHFKGGFRDDLSIIPPFVELPVIGGVKREIEARLRRLTPDKSNNTFSVSFYFNDKGYPKCMKLATLGFLWDQDRWRSQGPYVSEGCELVR